MRLLSVLLLAVSMVAVPSRAEEFPSEPYEFILAKLAADEGRFDEALSRLDKVLAKEPRNPVLMFERAMVLIDSGRSDRAEADLRKLVAVQPDFDDAHRVLGRILLERSGNDRNRMDEALVHLQAAFRGNPDDLPTGVTISQLLVAAGRTADAERVLAALVERAPDQRVLNYNYAQVLTKLGRGDESKQYLERAVLLDPTFGPAVMQLLDIYQKESAWEKAADVLQPLIEQDPLNIELQRQQAYFYLRSGQPEKSRRAFNALVDADPKDNRSLFFLAESLIDLEQYEEADRIYRKLLEQAPNDPDLLSSFGLSQVGQRKYDDAEKTFKQLLEVREVPENLAALARTQLANIELQRGNSDAAVARAREMFIFRDKPNPQAINIALEALRRQKRYAEALEILQPLTDRFGSDPFVNSRYVEMLLRVGDKEKARAAAATQAKFGPRNSAAVAEAYIANEDFAPALALLGDAAKSHPEDIDLQFALASAYERSADHGGAEKIFLRILERVPEHAATLNYLGYMWADNNVNLDRAAEMLTRAVSQEPRNGAYIDSLGWVYYRQGKLDLAEKYLTDATRLLPRDATVHAHLGDVFVKRGDAKRALDLYHLALTLEPAQKDEAQIRSKIATLEKQGR